MDQSETSVNIYLPLQGQLILILIETRSRYMYCCVHLETSIRNTGKSLVHGYRYKRPIHLNVLGTAAKTCKISQCYSPEIRNQSLPRAS